MPQIRSIKSMSVICKVKDFLSILKIKMLIFSNVLPNDSKKSDCSGCLCNIFHVSRIGMSRSAGVRSVGVRSVGVLLLSASRRSAAPGSVAPTDPGTSAETTPGAADLRDADR